MVHYTSYGTPSGEYVSKCRAAYVTEVPLRAGTTTGSVSLGVLNPTGLFFDIDVPYDTERGGGTWHYPHTTTP